MFKFESIPLAVAFRPLTEVNHNIVDEPLHARDVFGEVVDVDASERVCFREGQVDLLDPTIVVVLAEKLLEAASVVLVAIQMEQVAALDL